MPDALFTVIGDLVGSRQVADRGAVQDALARALEEVNEVVAVRQPFQPTIGDEYQGACASLPDAVLAALLVRLTLRPLVDVRTGLGFGSVTVHDPDRRPLLQDGPGWWAAREAVDALSERPGGRTWYAGPGARPQGADTAAGPPPAAGPAPDPGSVNAFLVCRDQIIERLNDRGLRILRLALLGHSQKEIAALEDIWPSAVSQQFSRNIGTILESMTLFGAPRVRA